MADLKIQIKTEAELKGIRDAAKEVDNLAQKSTDLDKTSKQLSTTQTTVAKAQEQVASSATKTTQSFVAADVAASLLNKTFGKLKSILFGFGWGLVIAGLGTVVEWIIKLGSKSEEVEPKLNKMVERFYDLAKANNKFAESTRDATKALEDQDKANIGRISDVEGAKLEAAQSVEKAQLEDRISSGELSGEDAVRARTGLAARHRSQDEALAEKIRQAKELALSRTEGRTQSDVATAQAALDQARAERDAFQATPLEQLSGAHQALIRSGDLTRKDLLFPYNLRVAQAADNLSRIQGEAAPVLSRIGESRADIGAERMVAGIRSGAAGQVEGINMNSGIEAEKRKQTESLLRTEQQLTSALEKLENSIRLQSGRLKVSRD